ncbi:hypothetical protein H0H92_013624 [Tricholoma furcatifolium]|nr:hypothetical protein H0H92_013624 [Tricholoma furcatifolium]
MGQTDAYQILRGFDGGILAFWSVCLFNANTLTLTPNSAGCIWNDILDRDFDAQVERTKFRPLVTRKISVTGAILFLSAHLFLLISMIWNVNPVAWNVGMLALFPLMGLYPLMKRITYWPQAWLGLAINIGISMAWAITTATIPDSSIVLSMGSFFWTLWYDTIYACQDKKDDVNAGVKSTALLFGSRVKQILAIFGTIFICSVTISGFLNAQSLPFYVISVFGGGLHLAWQLYTVHVDSPKSCWQTFEANGIYFGAIVEAGLLLDLMLSY